VWVQMAPEPGFSGQGKLVIQLGTDISDVAYDWTSLPADASASHIAAGGAETLVFDQQPAHSSGELQWSVRNGGELVVREGTPIGEWEIVDTDKSPRPSCSDRSCWPQPICCRTRSVGPRASIWRR